MAVNNKSNGRKRQSTLEKCLTELYNAVNKNDVNNIRKLITKAIKLIMEEDMVFDKHIVDLLSLYMDYEQNRPKTAVEFLERRFSIFAKICKSKLINLPYLGRMAVLTTKETKSCISMKIQNPELDEEQILRKVEDNFLQYEIEKKNPIEEKKPDTQPLDNLPSADSVLANSIMSDYSRSE